MGEPSNNTFFTRVYEIVAQIPSGRVISYGQIAALLGSPQSARQVGWAMSACPDGLPWQRVVKADGSVTGGEWAILRRKLLLEEGVEFLLDGRVDMEAHRWNPESLALALDDTLDEELRAELAEELSTLEVAD